MIRSSHLSWTPLLAAKQEPLAFLFTSDAKPEAFVTLLAASTITPGDVSIRCGVKLAGEPAENVWSHGCKVASRESTALPCIPSSCPRMFDICRQLTCSSVLVSTCRRLKKLPFPRCASLGGAEALRFPLLGPSENEDVQLEKNPEFRH